MTAWCSVKKNVFADYKKKNEKMPFQAAIIKHALKLI